MRRFDVVIIGSGCGKSPAAENLANAGFKVCVLERGTWWGELHGHTPFREDGLEFLGFPQRFTVFAKRLVPGGPFERMLTRYYRVR
jgi:choline dehydrogenase-like flavoprotein